MTFPQTSSIQSVLNGQEYWRLFTELESSGDIYETEQSGRAFVLGPQSDVAQIGLTYFDLQSPGSANCITVSVDKPMIGRLDAIGTEIYQSGDRARILISTNDLLPPIGFTPPSFTAGGLQVVKPSIDLLQYLSQEPTFIAPRANRNHMFENLPAGAAGSNWFLVPFYGRRFAEITAKILASAATAAGPPLTVEVYGLNFSNIIADPVVPDSGHQELLLSSVVIPAPALAAGPGVSGSIVLTNRAFDYLEVKLTYASAFPPTSFNLHVVTSDKI